MTLLFVPYGHGKLDLMFVHGRVRQGVLNESGIFARRAMVDQACEGLCYQRENSTFWCAEHRKDRLF